MKLDNELSLTKAIRALTAELKRHNDHCIQAPKKARKTQADFGRADYAPDEATAELREHFPAIDRGSGRQKPDK